MVKPAASLSLDLDNLWAYMRTHGDTDWRKYPSYFAVAIPRILEILAGLDLKVTFFIVGKDAELEKNHEFLKAINQAGHEIGNHSYSHEPLFHQYNSEGLYQEVVESERLIESVTGITPQGWRGPGFSCSEQLLELLTERGYQYDASTFPTFLGPLARLYYFMTGNFNKEDKQQREGLYGSWRDGLRPLRPFSWSLSNNRTLLELPVTTMPLFRTPMHMSYLLYLASYSPLLGRVYFRIGLRLCRLTGVSPSLLLHPTDFLGGDDVPELSWFPAMNKPSEWKQARVTELLELFSRHFNVLPMGRYVEQLEQSKDSIPLISYAQRAN